MTVHLTSRLESIVEAMMATGHYADPEDVIAEALRLLEERERRRQWLRSELAPALDQEARGELIDFTPEHFEDLQRRALEGARQGKPIRDAVKP